MNDYKELIAALREEAEAVQAIEWEIPICTSNHIAQAADAIEQLVKERDAAVADFVAKHCNKCIINYPYWEWRGEREDNDEID